MTPTRGFVYIAMGEPARREAAASIETLFDNLPYTVGNFDLRVLSDNTEPLTMDGYHVVPTLAYDDPTDPGARRLKTDLPLISPFAHTIYIDADTRVLGDISPLFALVEHWPIVLTTSTRQGSDTLGNCPPDDRKATFELYGTDSLVGLQCGVIGFQATNPDVRSLFQAWREEWERFQDRDQAAFLRALHRVPVPVWIVGRDYNGGSLVQHRYGAADRTRRPRL